MKKSTSYQQALDGIHANEIAHALRGGDVHDDQIEREHHQYEMDMGNVANGNQGFPDMAPPY